MNYEDKKIQLQLYIKMDLLIDIEVKAEERCCKVNELVEQILAEWIQKHKLDDDLCFIG